MRVVVASGLAIATALVVTVAASAAEAPLTTVDPGANATPLEQVIRARLQAGETAIALGAVALSLLLAFRRERIPAQPAPPGQPALPESVREVQLSRQRYGVAFARGTLEPSGRSGRRLSLRTGAGPAVSWQPPDPSFSVPIDGAAGAQPLAVLAAGGRAIASMDPVTGRVVFHEADLARLHGLGRRGRGLLLGPLLLATGAFAALADHALDGFLARNGGLSPSQLRLSLLVTAGYFALGEAVLLGAVLAVASAVLRRVRGAQFRRRYQTDLRAALEAAGVAPDADQQ
jgi:hypothetical protein